MNPKPLLIVFVFITTAGHSQVKIGDNPTTINSASLLELETTNKGFVLPRVALTNVTLAAPLATGPLTGTVVYNTSNTTTGGSGAGIYLWDGNKWILLSVSGSAATSWLLTGNSLTNSGTNFLGTTDNHPLRFKVNNQIAGFIDSASGGSNVFLGLSSGSTNTSAQQNTFIGNAAGNVSNGSYNTFMGSGSGVANTAGTNNVFMGYLAGRGNTTGTYNVAIGSGAGNGTGNTGSSNVYVGANTGMASSSSFNTFIGTNAGLSNTAGSNIFIGAQAGQSNNSGTPNQFIGFTAGGSNTTGSRNTFMGYLSGQSNITGSNNLFIGYTTGSSNTTGSNNTLIGYGSSVLSNNLSNAAAIGYNAKTGANNSFVIGDTTTGNAVNVGIGVRYPNKRLHIDAAPISNSNASDSLKIDNLASSASSYNKSLLIIDSITGYVSKQSLTALGLGNYWNLTGNAGTNYSKNFLGTIDNTSLRMRTNNTERVIIDSLGSVGIGSASFNPNLKEKFLVDYGTTTSNNIATFKGSINDYLQIGVQNINNGTNASSDFVATANDGTDSTYYIDMGINGSNYAPNVENFGGPHDGYLYTYGRNLVMGSQKAGSDIIFLSGGGVTRTNAVLRMDGTTGNIIVGTGDNQLNATGNIVRGPNGAGANIPGGILTLMGGSATGAGTGGDLTIAGGAGTGSGSGGNININGGTSASGTNGSVIFNTTSAERMRIDPLGNVGIGSPTPNNKLEITQGTSGNSGLRFTNLTSSSTGSAATTTSDKLLTVNSNGDVVMTNGLSYINTQSGTSYTLAASDNQEILYCTSSSAVTITVPNTLPAGFTCAIIQGGTGQLTFSGTGLQNAYSQFKTPSRYGSATIQTPMAGTNILSGQTSW